MSNHHKINEPHGIGQKTLRSYLIGFILSITLTLMSFSLIEVRFITSTYLYISLAALAITQLLVQSICFLGLNYRPESRYNLLSFLFTILIIVILTGGTLWIMFNLDYNMVN
ncbi:MAG: cytochrome o ubiquinol oxidase subunit IV [Gammaproteobacteria bacterium RIFCSPHIGHO2_12_FULL_42_13]|nr:MAG: cytochrome o ubiquinol oxidase subunit IV [Gammaproteobacteria bacterium RIFCSPHIGHO2_12_FULL_42_13]